MLGMSACVVLLFRVVHEEVLRMLVSGQPMQIRAEHTEVSRLLYSSESWSSQPWRILKCPSVLPPSTLSGAWFVGCRGPKSLRARRSPGRPDCEASEVRRSTVRASFMSSWCAAEALAAAEEPGREDEVACESWRSCRRGWGAAPFMSAGAGACEASGLGWWWPLAVLMMNAEQ